MWSNRKSSLGAVWLGMAALLACNWAQGARPAPVHFPMLVLASNHVAEAKLITLRQLAQSMGLEVSYRYARELSDDAEAERLFSGHRLVLFDAVSSKESGELYGRFEPLVRASRNTAFVALKPQSGHVLDAGLTPDVGGLLRDYYNQGGETNQRNLLRYLQRSAQPLASGAVPPPQYFPELGFYHPELPDLVTGDLTEFFQNRKHTVEQPVVGIVFSRDVIASGQTAVIDQLIKGLEMRGVTPLAFYHAAQGPGADYVTPLMIDGNPVVDLLLNTRIIHWGEQRRREYEQLGVPVLQLLPYSSGDQSAWEQDAAGVTPMGVPFYLAMPEIAGVQDPMVVSAVDPRTKKPQPIDYQLESVINKAVNLLQLRRTPAAEKRVAILFYNYPLGEQNAGASFLNVPESLSVIADGLRGAGYAVDEMEPKRFIDSIGAMLKPIARKEIHLEIPYQSLLEKDLAALLPMTDYLAWYRDLPATVRDAIEAQWGGPEESFSVVHRDGAAFFVIPRIRLGNLVMMPQPERGNRLGSELAIYHNKKIPVAHNYLAAYLYARKQFGAHALVHLGTHGSQEWLPGKERGLSVHDAGNLAVGDTPVIYPFIMDDVGEATQTKRRGRAVVISHLTPPFAAAGLYREIAELHELMHQYRELSEGAVRETTGQQILDRALEQNLVRDMGWEEAQVRARFDEWLDALHQHLSEMASDNQPLGLHTFGTVPEDGHLISTITQMLGHEYSELAYAWVAGTGGEMDSHEAEPHAEDGDAVAHSLLADYRELADSPPQQLVRHHVLTRDDYPEEMPQALRSQLDRAREYLEKFRGQEEMAGLLAALAGRYVAPGVGGDPLRNADALPSGRNLYSFDPSTIPTRAAWEAGSQLVESLIAEHYQTQGRYPEKIAFSLWSIETMRHLGVLESQVLRALGVRPVWNEQGRVTGVEIIPYGELKRPRVDVVVSVTGLYRDTFPGLMQQIAGAINQVARLDHPGNPVHAHSRKLVDQLTASGVATEEAELLSSVRIFSNESGNYGSGLDDAVLASDTWTTDERLANLYLSRMGFMYGADERVWGRRLTERDLFADNLSGTEAVVFSRSSNVYGMLTSDDPFQYFGGISLAVRALDGKSPAMYIANLRDPKSSRTERLQQFMARELRTRYFHPRWIEEAQAEQYAGALEVLSVVNNLWGWQVVDPTAVRNDQWQELFEIYIDDKYQMDMQQWFESSNAHALAQIMERMLEAVRKEYWTTDQQTLETLLQRFRDLAGRYDYQTENEDFSDFVESAAQRYGLNAITADIEEAVPPDSAATPASLAQKVQGQQLERVTKNAEEQPLEWLLMLLFAIVAMGFVAQLAAEKLRKRKPDRGRQGPGGRWSPRMVEQIAVGGAAG